MIDIEKERMLISKSMMSEELRYSLVRMPDDFFYLEEHRKYHRALKNIISAFKEFSGIAVSLELESMGVTHDDAVKWCASIYKMSSTSTGWETLLDAVKNNWRCLKARNAATGFQESLQSVGFDKAVAEFNANLLSVQDDQDDTTTMDTLDIEDILKVSEHIETGIFGLDRGIIGIPVGMMTIISARPSVGKTAFVLSVIRSACRAGKRSLMFSQETSKIDLARRLISAETGINLFSLRKGEEFMRANGVDVSLARKSWESMKGWMKNFEVYEGACKMHSLFAISERSVKTKNTRMVIVDHAGLVQSMNPKYVRRDQMSEFSGMTKAFAMRHNAAWVNLWQLNRTAHNDDPNMSQLKDSGAAEQDADLIILLNATDEERETNMLRTIVEKQRNGPVYEETIGFDRKTMKFW